MTEHEYGGNIVKNILMSESGKKTLSSGSYEYFLLKVDQDEIIKLEGLTSFCLIVFEKEESASIEVVENDIKLQKSESLQVENVAVNLKISGGSVELLVAGSNSDIKQREKSISHQVPKEIYKVTKPWGYELWINGQHPTYAFKKLFIKAGNRTSLQFHDKKKETNLLVSGKAKLHYSSTLMTDDIETLLGEVSEVELEPTCSIDTKPRVIHRIQALTDITLYEASTPHLDDVVRIADDNKRPDGRIKEEHSPL